ncbi:MAG: hypothetical protein ACKPJD_33385 [Planctomycetaceae bacterium]
MLRSRAGTLNRLSWAGGTPEAAAGAADSCVSGGLTGGGELFEPSVGTAFVQRSATATSAGSGGQMTMAWKAAKPEGSAGAGSISGGSGSGAACGRGSSVCAGWQASGVVWGAAGGCGGVAGLPVMPPAAIFCSASARVSFMGVAFRAVT